MEGDVNIQWKVIIPETIILSRASPINFTLSLDVIRDDVMINKLGGIGDNLRIFLGKSCLVCQEMNNVIMKLDIHSCSVPKENNPCNKSLC